MNIKKITLSVFFALNTTLSAFAYSENLSSNQLRANLDNYIYTENNLKNAIIGVKIKDLKTNQEIYSLNSSKLFVPASTTKILTSLMALEKLGKNFKFITTLNSDGVIKNNTLNGDLYFLFKGDPTFKSSNIDSLFSQLKEKEIKQIKGNIIVDNSYFDNILYGPGWMWDDMDSCDSSPITSIVIDNNCIKAKINIDNNKVTINSNNIKYDISNLKKSDKENIKTKIVDNILNVSGTVTQTTEIEQSVYNPEAYLENYLRNNILKDFNFKGKIIFNYNLNKEFPIKTLAFNESKPMSEILKFFNEESHNLTGEIITKAIGATESLPGSTQKGINVLKKYLTEKFSYNDFKIVDGSGLSRYNLLSPDLLVDALTYIYNNPEYRDIILEDFPLGGFEGTLKNRLKDMKKFKVIAKSGSMTGINNLSGYLINDTEAYAFSIMINNSNLGGKDLRDIQDKILYML